MNHQRPLLAITLILSISITGFGNRSSERADRLRALRTTTAVPSRLTRLDQAYLDAVTLLVGNNSCSQFFGGSASRMLDELVVTLQDRMIRDPKLGIRMSGRITSIVDPSNGVSYRLFKEAEINSIGPFYKSKAFPDDSFIPNVGSFRPATREARVLILLHELAHLIKGPDGAWLIPDDGGNPDLSKKNTLTVESKCGEQIRAL